MFFIFEAGHTHVCDIHQEVMEVLWNHFRGKPFLLSQDNIVCMKITTVIIRTQYDTKNNLQRSQCLCILSGLLPASNKTIVSHAYHNPKEQSTGQPLTTDTQVCFFLTESWVPENYL